MEVIASNLVEIEEFIGYKIKSCEVIETYGEHARACVVMEIPNTVQSAEYDNLCSKETLTLKHVEEGTILWAGIIQQCQVNHTIAVDELRVETVSWSIAIDKEKRTRSFQNKKMTYSELFDSIIGTVSGAKVIYSDDCEQSIERIFIQYDETDWEFLRRVASHCGWGVAVNAAKKAPYLYIGPIVYEVEPISHPVVADYGIAESFLALGGMRAGFLKEDFEYYDVELTNNYPLGATISYNRDTLRIWRKRIWLEGGVFHFRYRLGKNGLFHIKQKYNEKLAGVNFIGKVLDTSKEGVKLHLDMDISQDKETAYQFEWTPLSSNIMYCMPEMDTKVRLCLHDRDEMSAKVIASIQDEQESVSQGNGPSYRAFTTAGDKQIELMDEELSISTNKEKQRKDYIVLQDERQLFLKSTGVIMLLAEEKIEVDDETIVDVEALTELQLIQTGTTVDKADMAAPIADIEISGNISVNSEDGGESISSHGVRVTYDKFEDEPQEGEEPDWTDFIGPVLAGLAAVAAVAFVAFTLGAGALVVAGAVIAGAVTIGCMVYDDVQSGNVSHPGRYFIKGLTSAITGAVTVYFAPPGTSLVKTANVAAITTWGGNLSEQALEGMFYGDDFNVGEFAMSGAYAWGGTIVIGIGMAGLGKLFQGVGKLFAKYRMPSTARNNDRQFLRAFFKSWGYDGMDDRLKVINEIYENWCNTNGTTFVPFSSDQAGLAKAYGWVKTNEWSVFKYFYRNQLGNLKKFGEMSDFIGSPIWGETFTRQAQEIGGNDVSEGINNIFDNDVIDLEDYLKWVELYDALDRASYVDGTSIELVEDYIEQYAY